MEFKSKCSAKRNGQSVAIVVGQQKRYVDFNLNGFALRPCYFTCIRALVWRWLWRSDFMAREGSTCHTYIDRRAQQDSLMFVCDWKKTGSHKFQSTVNACVLYIHDCSQTHNTLTHRVVIYVFHSCIRTFQFDRVHYFNIPFCHFACAVSVFRFPLRCLLFVSMLFLRVFRVVSSYAARFHFIYFFFYWYASRWYVRESGNWMALRLHCMCV